VLKNPTKINKNSSFLKYSTEVITYLNTWTTYESKNRKRK